ncbi:hypothetical protein BJ508DRAFT_100033 [Ascobolus immersus RN42]|uniref:Uncharacterized protein n=1 Tax=Ascobolus immersus RN42 TaxID=1160509 RepID=A0A3N4ICT1_ASCIM|nr:hypothetical protein BJ508DRAFT_100033 [Ascobolus immersus RN42]
MRFSTIAAVSAIVLGVNAVANPDVVVYETQVVTITSCPPEKPACPASSTTYIPVVTPAPTTPAPEVTPTPEAPVVPISFYIVFSFRGERQASLVDITTLWVLGDEWGSIYHGQRV